MGRVLLGMLLLWVAVLVGGPASAADEMRWKGKKDHSGVEAFPLTGKHAELACAKCHAEDNARKGQTACNNCHAIVGAGGVMAPHPQPAGDWADCARCHLTDGRNMFDHGGDALKVGGFAREGASAAPGSQPVSEKTVVEGFPLIGPHAAVKCAQCHADGTFQAPKTYIDAGKPGPEACAGCHVGPHTGLDEARVGADCVQCHPAGLPFASHTFDRTRHGERHPLEGAHAELDCAACHTSKTLAVAARKSDAEGCAGCHTEPPHGPTYGMDCARCHQQTAWAMTGGFDHAVLGEALNNCATCHAGIEPHEGRFGDACAQCHQPTSWSDRVPFEHAAATGFRIDGLHAAVDCTDCHKPKAERPAPITDQCLHCHQDPHRGRAGLECDQCHTPDGWLMTRFNHDMTGFPLNGSHVAVPCRDCHVGDRFVGQPDECFHCHGGQMPSTHQFAERRFCGECHNTRAFVPATFRHDPPLTAVHLRVAPECNRCHTGGRQLIADACVLCHGGDQPPSHRAFLLDAPGGASDCNECHAANAAWAMTVFQHPNAPPMHQNGLPCSSCHPLPLDIKSGMNQCWGCHVNETPPGHPAPQNQDCVGCHRPSGFFPPLQGRGG